MPEHEEDSVEALRYSYLNQRLTVLEDKVRSECVSKAEFTPIKLLMYGFVSLILSGVFAAILALVLRKP